MIDVKIFDGFGDMKEELKPEDLSTTGLKDLEASLQEIQSAIDEIKEKNCLSW